MLGVTFLAQLGLLQWSRTLSPLVLLLAGGVLGVGALLERRRAGTAAEEGGGRVLVPAAQVALALALIAALATTARLELGARNWDSVAANREAQLAARLVDVDPEGQQTLVARGL